MRTATWATARANSDRPSGRRHVACLLGVAFAESPATAELYRDNPGFGGASLWRAERQEETEALDLRGLDVGEAAELLGQPHPGAIDVDEWLPRTMDALDAVRERGCLWALVDESYPAGTTTWIWCGHVLDPEPELTPCEG